MEQNVYVDVEQQSVSTDTTSITKKNQKILISDYDDTIIKGTGDIFLLICKSVLGNEEYKTMISLPENLGKEWFSAYLKYNSLTKEKVELIWEGFKKSEIYKKFCEAKNESINNVLQKMQVIPDTNVTEFYVKEILFPLIAMYGVYIKKLKPEEAFFDLYQQSKDNEDIFVINTYKPHEVIKIELQEYAKLNKEKYRAFQEILENDMVLGTTQESCKGDENRIKFILNWKSELLKTKTPEIIVMGDSYADCVNFEEAIKLHQISSSFLFINTRLNQDIQSLTNSCAEHTCNCKSQSKDTLIECCDELKKIHNKLQRAKEELEKIKNTKKTFVERVISGSYQEVAEKIYGSRLK